MIEGYTGESRTSYEIHTILSTSIELGREDLHFYIRYNLLMASHRFRFETNEECGLLNEVKVQICAVLTR